ncbi:MAG: anti-sigma factor [Piscinibacter sp.]|nr:anti-sigma factor [Piscinibacter sp.]
MDYSRPELADRLAADYVAGTLRGPARRRFEALLPAHAGLRAAVRAWQARLMPLTAVLPPQTPSPQVWRRIEARIGGAPAAAAAPARWWARLAFWRGLSALATVAALSLAVLLASPGPAQPPIVVVLNAATPPAAGGIVPASFVASISGDGRAVVTRPLIDVALPPQRVLELWAAAGSNPPRSLGLISERGATVVRQARLPAGTDHLAVSLEPPGGSPTGAPTGPVLYVGRLGI